MRGDNSNRWMEAQCELMQQLRAEGVHWNLIAERVGHPIASCQNTMTRYNNARRAAKAQADRKALREAADALNAAQPLREAMAKLKLAAPSRVRIVGPAEPQGYASISTAKLVMHAELQSRIEVLGVTGGLLGDPLPGRSALDKRALP